MESCGLKFPDRARMTLIDDLYLSCRYSRRVSEEVEGRSIGGEGGAVCLAYLSVGGDAVLFQERQGLSML